MKTHLVTQYWKQALQMQLMQKKFHIEAYPEEAYSNPL